MYVGNHWEVIVAHQVVRERTDSERYLDLRKMKDKTVMNWFYRVESPGIFQVAINL